MKTYQGVFVAPGKRKNHTRRAPGPGAKVVTFPGLNNRVNRLTSLDRQEAKAWAEGDAGLWCSIMIYADADEPEEIGDFVSVYRRGHAWASWGAARRGQSVLLWRSDIGSNLGIFSSMALALDAIIPPVVNLTPVPSIEGALHVALRIIRQRIAIAKRMLADHRRTGRTMSEAFCLQTLAELRQQERTILAELPAASIPSRDRS